MRIEIEYWITVIFGLILHYVDVRYYNWKVEALDEPNWMSWLFVFSVLCTLSWVKFHIIRLKKGRPPICLNRMISFIIAIFLTHVILNHVWLPICGSITDLNVNLIETIRKHEIAKTLTGLKLMHWIKVHSLDQIRVVLSVTTFLLMLQLTNFWQTAIATVRSTFSRSHSRPYNTNSLDHVLRKQGRVR